MKKTRIFAAGLMVLLAFTTAGCGKESEEEVFQRILFPLMRRSLRLWRKEIRETISSR